MCLALPMKIIKIEGTRAIAEAHQVETAVDLSLAPDVKVGDKVIIHAGFVIEKLDEEAAREIEKVWEEFLAMAGDEDTA